MKLIRYRDWGMTTHTWFWVTNDDKTVGPYFDDEESAKKWMEEQIEKVKEANDNPIP